MRFLVRYTIPVESRPVPVPTVGVTQHEVDYAVIASARERLQMEDDPLLRGLVAVAGRLHRERLS